MTMIITQSPAGLMTNTTCLHKCEFEYVLRIMNMSEYMNVHCECISDGTLFFITIVLDFETVCVWREV